MFDVRIRLMSDALVLGRVLPTKTLSWTGPESGTAALRFQIAAGEVPESPFLVQVQYTVDGAEWVAPRNDLFIAAEDDADDADAAKIFSFTGELFVPWLMARMHVQSSFETIEGQRRWVAKSPGHVLNVLISEAKNNGWGPQVTSTFTSTHDSNGQAWPEAKDWAYQLLTPMTRVLQGMAQTGFVEWWTQGGELRAVVAGTGADLSESVVLGGPGYDRAPSKTTFDDVFTNLTIRIDSPGEWAWLVNEGADMRFGRLWSTMTQSGVETVAEATRNAQPAMIAGRAKKREQSYSWSPRPGLPVPWSDFNVGDTVTVRSRSAKLSLRVIKLDISKDDKGKVTATAVVGDKLLSLSAKIAQRTAAASMGQIISGSGDAFPATPAPEGARPSAPTGLHASDAPYWREDGSAASVVTLGWNAVAQSTDGTLADVSIYEVWARSEADQSSAFVQTDALTTTTDLWEPGKTRRVKVRAQSRGGAWSEFSDEISVTPGSPASIVPKSPTGLAVTSNVAAFRADGSAIATVAFTWVAVTQSIEDVLVSIVAYEVWEGTDADPGVTLLVTGTPGASQQWDSGAVRHLRVRAQSDLGVWSDFSDELLVTPATPAAPTMIPTAAMLTTGGGNVIGAWSGTLTTGAPGAGFQHVIVESVESETTPTGSAVWERKGPPITREAGGFLLRAPKGTQVWVRLRAVDTLGRIGDPSELASIVVAGISGPDVEVNSLEGNVIRAGTLSVDRVEPNFAAGLELASNGYVQTIINTQSAQGSQITAAQDAASLAGQTAQQAAQDAATANAGVSTVQGQVGTLQGQHAATAGEVAMIQTWFRVDAEGGHMGRSDSAFQSHIKPDRFEITQDGVPRAWLEANRLVAPEFVGLTVVLSNHKLEQFGTGTVVRRLG